MTTINDLRETRATKTAEMRTLHDKASGENRDLTTEERARFDALDGEVRTLGNRLTDAEKLAQFEKFEARAETPSDLSRDLGRYSLAKALTESRSGALSGIEAEAHAELSRGRSEVDRKSVV